MTSLQNSAQQTQTLARGFEGFDLRRVDRDGVSLGYRIAGEGPAVLLIHGWPQTGYTWHQIAARLSGSYTVIVPDYRGAGASDKPAGGYDKATMAADLHAVIADAGISQAHVVGHDIGTMVAYSFARQFPDATTTLSLLDGFVPGTPMFSTIMSSLGPWHFGFHSQVDLAVSLVSGREREYFDYWYTAVMVDPQLVSDADRDFYADQFRAPAALAAGFRTYEAATSVDISENESVLAANGKLSLPVLGIGGASSLGPYFGAVLADIADDITVVSIEGAGHFLPEEKPDDVATVLREFFEKKTGDGPLG